MIRRTSVVAALTVLLAALPAAAFDLNLALGVDFAGDFDVGNISLSSDTGYSLGLELAFKVPIVELGVGFEYGFSREAQAGDLKASYTQLYGIGRVFFGPVYVAARLGYADLSVSSVLEGGFDGGGTWGVGGGVELFDKLKIELLFNSISGDLTYQSWTGRLLYTF